MTLVDVSWVTCWPSCSCDVQASIRSAYLVLDGVAWTPNERAQWTPEPL